MTVEQLFQNASSDAKGKVQSPTAGSTEWNQWLAWANEELSTFAEVHDWPEYRHNSYPITSNVSSTSLAIPDNFKKAVGSLVLNGKFYSEVDSDQFDKYTNSSQVFRTGYDGGWFVEWKGALTSGASGIFPMSIYPTSLATSTDKVVMRNPTYLVKRLKTRIFKYRQDPIFSEIEAESDVLLQQMIENEYYKHDQYKGGATTREEEQGFTLGID